MKLLKRTIILLLLLSFPLITLAETTNTQKPEISVKGINVSLGYSYGSITSNLQYINQTITSKITKQNTLKSASNKETFNISLNIGLIFSKKFDVDFLFAYNHNDGILEESPLVPSNRLPYSEQWITLMPGVKYNWITKEMGTNKKGIFKMYSKANIGVSLVNRYQNLDGGRTANSVGTFAYQVVPLGLEVGWKVFRFFCEGGYGYTGYARGGLKFSFGN